MNADSSTTGACYGFNVTSELPLSYVRHRAGTGTPLEVRFAAEAPPEGELLQRWDIGRNGRGVTQLFAVDDEVYVVHKSPDIAFEVRSKQSQILIHPGSVDGLLLESMLWGTPAAVALTRRNALPLHAGSVDVDGWGILLAAPGTLGKTTLAGAFHAAGHRMLADDMSGAVLTPIPALLPGPAVIRARPDVAELFRFDRTEAVLTTPARTHLALTPQTKGNGEPVPLRAIVFLRVSEGPIQIEEATTPDVVRDLHGLAFRFPTDEGTAAAFENAASLAGRVPGWNLYRPLTPDSLPGVINLIIERCLG
jgi:hypothetical protein